MIRVTTEDTETGDVETREIEPGDYCIVTAWPLFLAHTTVFSNGTTQLTLKKAADATQDAG